VQVASLLKVAVTDAGRVAYFWVKDVHETDRVFSGGLNKRQVGLSCD